MVIALERGRLFELVNQAYADYTFALDANDAVVVAECFTPDGIWSISGREPLKGRADIAAFVEETAGDRPRHHYANLGLVEQGDQSVHSRAYFYLVSASDGAIVAYGEYADELVGNEEPATRLQFVRRDIEFLWLQEAYAKRGRAGRSTES